MSTVADTVISAGKEAFLREAEQGGLDPKGMRMRCPWAGCSDKGADRDHDAALYDGGRGHYRLKCHACGTAGDLIDLLQRTRKMSQEEAIKHLQPPEGYVAPPRPPPDLRVVGAPPKEDGKMSPDKVKRVWESLGTVEELGESYLRERGRHDAVELGHVKLISTMHRDKAVSALAKGRYRVAMLASDVTGQPRGIQVRYCGQPNASQPKILSVTGSATGRSFFGTPWAIEAAEVVCVTEGIFDTLAVQSWAPKGMAVAGAPGKDVLPRLADELAMAGVGVDGKLFAMFIQNDPPPNKSRQKFVELARKLAERGARICYIATPPIYSDVGDWRKVEAVMEWPPKELGEAMRGVEREQEARLDDGSVSDVALPEAVRVDALTQDCRTLVALLDDPTHRPGIMGSDGEFWTDVMTGLEMFGRKPFRRPADIISMKLNLESYQNSSNSKRLKFSKMEIEDAISLLCARDARHPCERYLAGLPEWDGVKRWEQCAGALGCDEPLAPTLLRRWGISAVARMMRPGCKVDTVLVLVGGQGSGKSTWLKTMGGIGFTDSHIDIRKDESKRQASLYWIIEWSELTMLDNRNVEQVKAFLSSSEDTYRLPYSRDMTTTKRRGVIAGTTNKDRFLGDPTGSRRIWPVRTGIVDLEWTAKHRDQLWAEAKAAFKAGERWWLTKEEDADLAEMSACRDETLDDPWKDTISDWLERTGAERPTTTNILELAINKPTSQTTHADALRVGRVMRVLGWEGPVRTRFGERLAYAFRKKEE